MARGPDDGMFEGMFAVRERWLVTHTRTGWREEMTRRGPNTHRGRQMKERLVLDAYDADINREAANGRNMYFRTYSSQAYPKWDRAVHLSSPLSVIRHWWTAIWSGQYTFGLWLNERQWSSLHSPPRLLSLWWWLNAIAWCHLVRIDGEVWAIKC